MRVRPRAWKIRAMALDWQRIVFTEHMVEAAAVVAECHVAFDFEGDETVAYEIKVYRTLKGDGDPYFAVGVNRADADGIPARRHRRHGRGRAERLPREGGRAPPAAGEAEELATEPLRS